MLSHGLTKQDIERMVHEEIRALLVEQEVRIVQLSGEEKLHADLGLSSLDLARLVTILEMKLQADPFETLVPITSVRSVGDLVHAYQLLLTEPLATSAVDAALLASQKRAQARRHPKDSV